LTPEEFQLSDLEIVTFELGLAMTNTYLLGDPDTKSAIVIDPAWDGEQIAGAALERGWQINAIWLTHAHFDHFGGVSGIEKSIDTLIPVALHPLDLPLWQTHGGAGFFGITEFDPGPEPTIDLETGMELTLGNYRFEVRHTPGHSLGHVIFVSEGLGRSSAATSSSLGVLGEQIFRGGIGIRCFRASARRSLSFRTRPVCSPVMVHPRRLARSAGAILSLQGRFYKWNSSRYCRLLIK
jgi:glyoxylase-like metal-dependent hydrolase (beta-lactamase superfamily II)